MCGEIQNHSQGNHGETVSHDNVAMETNTSGDMWCRCKVYVFITLTKELRYKIVIHGEELDFKRYPDTLTNRL